MQYFQSDKRSKHTKHLSNKIILLLMFIASFSFAQEFGARKVLKHRISIGGVKSFYQNHKQHTDATKAKFGFGAAYRMEFTIGRRSSLLVGPEYQSTGLTFKGYYKKPGYTYLFDKTFAYTHELRIQEVQLPVILKICFNSEKESPYSPYFIGGVGARYIFASYSVISNDSTGITVYDAKDNIDFENQLVTKGLNAFFQSGLGFQKNVRTSTRAYFFEVSYKYCISRFHYDGNDKSNDLNIRDSHLLFSIGMRM
jgi:outer membrane protein with beta-barrel domain